VKLKLQRICKQDGFGQHPNINFCFYYKVLIIIMLQNVNGNFHSKSMISHGNLIKKMPILGLKNLIYGNFFGNFFITYE